ncbi:preprotein translocase subunit SecE [Apilactobacillus xinyiensis]|uniref:Protein translocase subunit SecE n=1 Tax=Apilactobacillus xinyiensis TaxID=2841032 RepID=A0ABT0I2T8_9LACO|nr:preprotein translocase subunit SecE [Apilactobacillus xinyiensis]MCK8625018.1 preprotein translocase subunit SecE [Apilactobacillus xinyiensis]MCL0312695.1 preprotein translocase subunit SecE [Apilactobacillus xinyiensis]MCL0319086.1 preprotein translocase subunit SecE [Apilactobacillus xinyiensis]MCL0330321.1 preprotein translocase subunit SecE [Apilactobacillus xinyiensis]
MKLFGFFRNVKSEMKKVVWPNAKQTKTDTSTVIGMSIMFAIFFAVVDFLVQYALHLV